MTSITISIVTISPHFFSFMYIIENATNILEFSPFSTSMASLISLTPLNAVSLLLRHPPSQPTLLRLLQRLMERYHNYIVHLFSRNTQLSLFRIDKSSLWVRMYHGILKYSKRIQYQVPFESTPRISLFIQHFPDLSTQTSHIDFSYAH